MHLGSDTQCRADDGGEVLWCRRWCFPSLQHDPLNRLGFGVGSYGGDGEPVTPDFPKKTKCISYVHQDQVYAHMIDVMSEISINSDKNVQELNHYIMSLLHSDVRLEGLYNDETITMKMKLRLHLPQEHDWGHASLRTSRSR
jgi:hypothetical protein